MAITSPAQNVELKLVSDEPEPPLASPPQTVVLAIDTLADALRLAPLADALRRREALRQLVVHTGPRSGGFMSDEALAIVGLPRRRRALGLVDGTHAERTALALRSFEAVLIRAQPCVVLVAGDSDATLACALAAAKLGLPVMHAEAGLRAGDWSVPEEVNRVLCDRLCDTLLTHSTEAKRNLLDEGVDGGRVYQIGSLLVDSVRALEDRARTRAMWSAAGLERRAYVLVALEHPSNVSGGERFEAIVDALANLARQGPVVFVVPVEHEAALRREGWPERLALHGVMCVTAPGYLDVLSLKAGAGAIVTDAGVVQDEASALGVPCYTLGAVTERALTLSHGTNVLLGDDASEIAFVAPTTRTPVPCELPLWDGKAAERAADVLVAHYVLTGTAAAR